MIMFVPPLPKWTSRRVALIGDVAYGLSPNIAAGGTLGIEDVMVLVNLLSTHKEIGHALAEYEAIRMPHYATVNRLSLEVERAADAYEYADRYARFSRWMLNKGREKSFVAGAVRTSRHV